MPSRARIFRPTKSAMQSGKRNTEQWLLEYEPRDPRFIEHIMGWTGSSDTSRQVRVPFNTKEEAIQFCQKHSIDYHVQDPKQPRFIAKSYADNFAYNRIDTYQQTHKPEA